MNLIKTLAVATMCVVTASANAESAETTEKKSVETSKAKTIDPLEACAGMLEKADWGFVATFPNGARFEVVQHPSGMPHSFAYRSADGAEETAHVSDYIAKAESEAAKAADPAMRSEAYGKLQSRVARSFRTFLGANCKRLLVKPVQDGGKSAEGGMQSAFEGEDPFRPDYRDLFDMNEYAFRREADSMVADMFHSGLSDFFEKLKNKLPECRNVVTDCQSTCDRIGTYGGGVGCVSLGAVASAVLTAPIGLAVGAYCAGKVFVKVEECRGACNLPVVQCTW